MAITGITKTEAEEYASVQDNAPDDQKTKFLLGVLDADVRAKIGDRGMTLSQSTDGGTDYHMNSGTRNLEAVRFGLRGWVNFKGENGSDIPFVTTQRFVNGKQVQCVSDETMNTIPGWLMNELGNEILIRNTMTEELAKKLKGE